MAERDDEFEQALRARRIERMALFMVAAAPAWLAQREAVLLTAASTPSTASTGSATY